MNAQQITDAASALLPILTQIYNSAKALSTDNPDDLADLGAGEGGRLDKAVKEFFDALPTLVIALTPSAAAEMASAVASRRLAKLAHGVAEQDANRLQIMGRAYQGREEERLGKELAALPHLKAAIEALK